MTFRLICLLNCAHQMGDPAFVHGKVLTKVSVLSGKGISYISLR